MTGFLAGLLAVALTGFGGRDQLLLARMAGKYGQAGPLLMVAWATTIITAIVMAFAGLAIVDIMPDAARTMIVAIALLFAAFELAWPIRAKKLAEPTQSLGALFLVLLIRQLTDSPRFIIFALAIWGDNPWLAALGGAMAGGAGLTLGWVLGEELESGAPLRAIRIGLAVIIGIAAIAVGLTARGLGS